MESHVQNHPLPQILILLVAAVLVVALFRRLKLSPVLGYLVAGAAIGPYGLGFIRDITDTAIIAEFGVVFLLFIIGTELSLKRLQVMRHQVFGFGGAQVLITGLVLAIVVRLSGLPMEVAIVIGFSLALSSTALVLQLLTETRERDTQLGRASLAVLLMQDIAVVPLLVLVPLLAGNEASMGEALGIAAVKALAAFALVFTAGRLFLKPLFRSVASLDHAELFTAFTLLIVLGISWGFHSAGLSMPLGAFIAGLLVAETEYKHQVEADVMPYKGLFMGLFFMVVGMSVDFALLLSEFWHVMGMVFGLMISKTLLLYGLCRLMRYPAISSIRTALLLSQGGEFAFIVLGLAAEYAILPARPTQLLMVVVATSMALTPLAYVLGRWLASRMKNPPSPLAVEAEEDTLDLEQHVVILGYGRVGQTIGKLLSAESIPYIALDMDPFIVTECRKRGNPIYYGDGSRREVLNAVSLSRAKAAVLTFNDFYMASKAVVAIKNLVPDLHVIARTSDLKHLLKLEAAGADIAVSEMFEASLQLGGAVLRELDVAEHEISRITDVFRERDYALTRANEVTHDNEEEDAAEDGLYEQAHASGIHARHEPR